MSVVILLNVTRLEERITNAQLCSQVVNFGSRVTATFVNLAVVVLHSLLIRTHVTSGSDDVDRPTLANNLLPAFLQLDVDFSAAFGKTNLLDLNQATTLKIKHNKAREFF